MELPKLSEIELPNIPIKNPLNTVDTSFNKQDDYRDKFMLHGALAKEGYDWWWHSFTAHHADTGEEKAFFIEFFAINPELGGGAPVFGQLEESRKNGIKPSYLMVKVGTWGADARQVHRFFGWNDVTIKEELPFLLSADECFLSETRTLGKVKVTEDDAAAHPEYMCDAGEMIWDLHIDKQIAFNVGYGASKAAREIDAFQMFWHVQGMKTAFSGDLYWNGQHYVVDKNTCYGYADKNWGKDFTSPWVWLTSNNLTSKITGKKLENTVFDIGGGRPKVGPFAFEHKLLSAIWYEGTPYEFNFSKFWTMTKTKFRCKENKKRLIWQVEQETPMHKMTIQVTCEKEDMLLINYEAPDGVKRHENLWNGGNGVGELKLYKKKMSLKNKWEWELVDDMEIANVGCEYGEYSKQYQEEQNRIAKESLKNNKEKEA